MRPTSLAGGRPALSIDVRRLAWPWGPVVLSRLLALGAGAAGAGLWTRATGWERFDREHLTESFGRVGNVLAGGVVRWDSIHYLQIAAGGYKRAWVAFFPLYPLTIKVLGAVLSSNALAGALISLVSFFVALALLHRTTSEELSGRAADATVLLLAFAPTAFFFSAVYTESLFLALSVGAFYAARRRRWILAWLCAAAAAITHVEGVLLVIPLLLIWWGSEHRTWRGALPACLPPLALVGFLLYLRDHGFGLLAPFHDQAEHLRRFSGPIVAIRRAASGAWVGVKDIFKGGRLVVSRADSPLSHGFHNLVEFGVLVICVVALVAVWRRLPRQYGAYATLVLLVSIWSPAKYVPLQGLERFALVMFPLWMVAGNWLVRRRLLYPVALVGAACMCFYAIEFGRWSFIG